MAVSAIRKRKLNVPYSFGERGNWFRIGVEILSKKPELIEDKDTLLNMIEHFAWEAEITVNYKKRRSIKQIVKKFQETSKSDMEELTRSAKPYPEYEKYINSALSKFSYD